MVTTSFYTVFCIGALALLALLHSPGEAHAEEREREWSVCVYRGKWSNNRIGEILQGRRVIRSSYIWAAGIARPVYRFSEDLLLEAELNIATHAGMQSHSEFNAAVNLRWLRFPWDRHVNSTASFGLGPSYAHERPPIETSHTRHTPARLLVFMPVEMTFAPPERKDSSWEVLCRIHHRSGAYGVVSNAKGSNFIAAGLRWRF